MPLHLEDFGKDLVTLRKNDLFFLDANFIIAYHYEEDRYNKACTVFYHYLLYQNITLCISEVVVAEVINGLARLFYMDEQVATVGGDPRHHRSRWGTYVLKRDKASLAKFNQLACEKLAPFLDLCFIVSADGEQLLHGMQMSYEYPLASSDALIVSSAYSIDAVGIVSLDRDMTLVTELNVYTTNVDNSRFDPSPMLTRMGVRFQNYLLSELGDDYHALFPQPAPSASNTT